MIHPKDVIGEMRTDHDIKILYSMAWRAKEYFEDLAYGEALHFFQKLHRICICLSKKKNQKR